MSAAEALAVPRPHPGGYTLDDLDTIPAEVHAEIVEGSLLISPSPSSHHNRVGRRLANLLEDSAPAAILLTTDVDVVLQTAYPTRTRRPDVIAYLDEAEEIGGKLTAKDCRLVVEIVSPDSVERDHVTKRDEYAAHGVPAYWVVETDPLAVVEYRLIGETFQPGERVTGWFETDWPWPVAFDVAELGRRR